MAGSGPEAQAFVPPGLFHFFEQNCATHQIRDNLILRTRNGTKPDLLERERQELTPQKSDTCENIETIG
jgi:hypothetical protein